MTQNEEETQRQEKIEEMAEVVEEENAAEVEVEENVEEVETDEYDRRSDEEKKVDLDLVEQDLIEEIEEPEPEGPGPENLKEEPEIQEYPDYLEIVVDGQKRKVAASKVWDSGLRTLQKISAADSRLEEAANLKREAEQSLEKARARAEQIAPPPEERKIVREIATKFEATYPELAGDEYLKTLTIMEADRRLSQGEENSWDVYEQSARAVKQWHARIASERITKEQFQTKLNRKRAASASTVRGVNAKTEPMKKQEEPEETVSDVILEMRKARKQPV